MMHQPDNARTLQQAKASISSSMRRPSRGRWRWKISKPFSPPAFRSRPSSRPSKDGQITVHLRVIGPRDRDVQLVQNLEHSRHFVMPRIVGETAESAGGPGAARRTGERIESRRLRCARRLQSGNARGTKQAQAKAAGEEAATGQASHLPPSSIHTTPPRRPYRHANTHISSPTPERSAATMSRNLASQETNSSHRRSHGTMSAWAY